MDDGGIRKTFDTSVKRSACDVCSAKHLSNLKLCGVPLCGTHASPVSGSRFTIDAWPGAGRTRTKTRMFPFSSWRQPRDALSQR